jgi:long-chain fatty acid transport protein
VLGVQLIMPAQNLQSQAAFFSDEREQFFGNSLHFEMLGDRLTLPVISFALGGRINRQLSWGVGASMGMATSVTSPVFVPDAGDYSIVYLDNNLSVTSKLSPHLGVIYRPVPQVTVSVTVHAPFKVEVQGKNRIRVSDTDPVDQVFTFVNGYEPLTATVGGEWKLADDGQGLGIVGTFGWRQWSTYEDRHGEKPLDAWNDTFTAALGARWVADALTLHLDGQYTPSPVPAQDGRTNYVDNDRAGLAAGASLDTSFMGRRLRASLALQGQRLLAHHEQKRADAAHPIFDEFPDDSVNTALDPLPEAVGFQTNNPGYPGYASSGWLFGAGVSLETWF